MSEPSESNVTQAVPFFRVSNMETSVPFYVEGIGCTISNRWDVEGKLQWCSLKLGDAAIMLQNYGGGSDKLKSLPPNPGAGISIAFQCRDAIALYRDFIANGLDAQKPFVGNGMWVTMLKDPDGYQLEFESFTDVPEGTEYAE